jgi:diguanylate cyclase (GGDEF)-like protein
MRLSFNRILWGMVGLILLLSLIVGIEENYESRRSMRDEIEKSIVYTAMKLDDFFVGNFEKIHQSFNSSLELDRQKLFLALDYFDRMDRDLMPIHRTLNEHKAFGSYDVYLIDHNRVIRRATFPLDVGLDFHDFPFAMKVFDMVEKEEIPFHISQPIYMPPSNDIRRYLLARAKEGNFFVQISHNYSPQEDLDEGVRKIQASDPQIESLKVFFLINGMLSSPESRHRYLDKKDYFKRLNGEKKKFLDTFSKELGLKIDREAILHDPMEVHRFFQAHKLSYRIDEARRRAIIYSATENIFNDKLNQEMIILRMEYDLTPIYQRYEKARWRVFMILGVSALILLLLFYGIKVLLIDKIRAIVEALRRDEAIRLPAPQIVEFDQLVEAVDGYRKRLAMRNRELEMLTLIDPLTGAYNRRHFSRVLEEKIYEASRYPGRRFALLIFDIDNFKEINDRYGHDTGDEVLKELSHHVMRSIRESDLFFRIGGEEFALLISPVESPEQVRRVAEKLRKSIAEASFGPGLHITISVGYSLFGDEDDSASLFRRVDSLLYRSKKEGKNRVSGDGG